MKVILAATDFSKTARNAINYAAEIAIRTKSRLILFHVYRPPVIVSDVPVMTPSAEELEKDSMKWLKKIRTGLISKHSRLDVDMVCMNNSAVEGITTCAREYRADLIVMGTHGAGYLEEALLGSVTSELIKTSPIPVLSVPGMAKFKSLKKIVLATDYAELNSKDTLNPLKELAGLFHSHIYVVHIVDKETTVPTVSQAVESIKLENTLQNHKHSFHTSTNINLVKGLNEFLESHHVDLLVMVPRKHTFIQSVFKTRNSKAMLFHTNTPILTIYE